MADLSRVWVEVHAALPLSWEIQELRRLRGNAELWEAVAAGPEGDELHAQGITEIRALAALAARLRAVRGSMSG